MPREGHPSIDGSDDGRQAAMGKAAAGRAASEAAHLSRSTSPPSPPAIIIAVLTARHRGPGGALTGEVRCRGVPWAAGACPFCPCPPPTRSRGWRGCGRAHPASARIGTAPHRVAGTLRAS
mmetsp:Transcript_22800/g.59471  ORF Transcript_22800/g.59471 Transcript_22800/m.59471 type:complete len:121 (-) Transcript_22800:436-798(-)